MKFITTWDNAHNNSNNNNNKRQREEKKNSSDLSSQFVLQSDSHQTCKCADGMTYNSPRLGAMQDNVNNFFRQKTAFNLQLQL